MKELPVANGTIRDMRVFDKALTKAEVRELFVEDALDVKDALEALSEPGSIPLEVLEKELK